MKTLRYLLFFGIAKGSAAEIETQLLIVDRAYSLDISDLMSLLYEIRMMLDSLNKKLVAIATSQTTNYQLKTVAR